jgi:hypothetical protein
MFIVCGLDGLNATEDEEPTLVACNALPIGGFAVLVETAAGGMSAWSNKI